MKRIGRLFDGICDRAQLAAAAGRAATGRRHRGEIRQFFKNWNAELARIGCRLSNGEFEFSPYRSFAVRDTKSRTIHAPSFRDRVVHQSIIGVTGPTFEMGAIEQSYACRQGRGQHAALAQACHWTHRLDWYGKMDVARFYDSVDHAILRRLLARRFRERRLLGLFDRLLDSYQSTPGKGLPIGALTSQYLGNFYLDEFDRQMKAIGIVPRYVRYMDDVVIWGTSEVIEILREKAVSILATLGLTLKHGGEWNRCERGIPFLGFVIYPDRLRLGRQGRKRLRRKTTAVEKRWETGEISEAELQSTGASLFAHAQTGSDSAWRRAVLAFGRYDPPGETQESRSRHARRLLEQHSQELPFCDSQQEEAGQP